MTKELEIVKHEVDWLKIIKLAFERKNWGQVYNLFVSGDAKITCQLFQFNFEYNRADFKIVGLYNYKEESMQHEGWYNYKTVSYNMDNFTLNDFKRLIDRSVKSLIREIIKYATKEEGERKFRELKHFYWSINLTKEIKQLGLEKDYDKILAIRDENMMENCLLAFKKQLCTMLNKDYDAKLAEHMENNIAIIPGLKDILEDLENDKKIQE